MIEKSLYDYQQAQINQASNMLSKGKRKIAVQLNTGGGKTLEFATIANRYINTTFKRVFIMVHRNELMHQASETLTEWYGVDHQLIEKGNKNVFDRPVYIGMIETVFRRMNNNSNYFPEIGLIILDEAHIGNFKKIHSLFPNSLILGFTATPKYSTKAYPINLDYEDIVVGPQVKELINRKKLCQNITYSINDINRTIFKPKGNDFDITQMAIEYSKVRHVRNVINMHEEIAPNTKTICYNVNVEHSLVVAQAYRERGYDVRHVDGTTNEKERDAIFEWFSGNDVNVLCNVGVATMGYDNKYVRNIIDNFSTLSLEKWLQTSGRGARICPEIDKWFFSIIDMGGNAKYHLDWNEDRDWRDIFFNPPKKRSKTDAAPYKDCPKCKALIPMQSRVCPYCGYAFPIKEVKYDTAPIQLELVTKNLNVKYLCETHSSKNKWYTLFYIINNLVTQAKYKTTNLSKDNAEKIMQTYIPMAKEWCETMNMNWRVYEKSCTRYMTDKLKDVFNYDTSANFNKIQNINDIHTMLFQL